MIVRISVADAFIKKRQQSCLYGPVPVQPARMAKISSGTGCRLLHTVLVMNDLAISAGTEWN